MKLPGKRRGFSLVELLVVIILLALLATLLTLILRQTLQLERTQTEGFDRVLLTSSLADQFRADVAQAEKAPSAWQDYRADEHTLILQMKAGERLIYCWRDGQLQRLAYTDRPNNAPANAIPLGVAALGAFDEHVRTERTLPIGKRVAVEFVHGDARLVRLRLIALREGKPVPSQTTEIAAALGGDWR